MEREYAYQPQEPASSQQAEAIHRRIKRLVPQSTPGENVYVVQMMHPLVPVGDFSRFEAGWGYHAELGEFSSVETTTTRLDLGKGVEEVTVWSIDQDLSKTPPEYQVRKEVYIESDAMPPGNTLPESDQEILVDKLRTLGYLKDTDQEGFDTDEQLAQGPQMSLGELFELLSILEDKEATSSLQEELGMNIVSKEEADGMLQKLNSTAPYTN